MLTRQIGYSLWNFDSKIFFLLKIFFFMVSLFKNACICLIFFIINVECQLDIKNFFFWSCHKCTSIIVLYCCIFNGIGNHFERTHHTYYGAVKQLRYIFVIRHRVKKLLIVLIRKVKKIFLKSHKIFYLSGKLAYACFW